MVEVACGSEDVGGAGRVVMETLNVPEGAGRRETSATEDSNVERSSWAYFIIIIIWSASAPPPLVLDSSGGRGGGGALRRRRGASICTGCSILS